MRVFSQIDRFYYVMAVVMLLLSALVIVTLRGVFSALKTSSEIDNSLLEASLPRVNRQNIEQAIESIDSKNIVPLDLNQ